MVKFTPTSARQTQAAHHRRRARKLEHSIRMQQTSTSPVIPSISFSRLVREILADHGEFSIRANAMSALQCAAEEHVTDIFNNAGRLASYQKRDTVLRSDFRFFTGVSESEEPATDATIEEDSAPPLPVPVQ